MTCPTEHVEQVALMKRAAASKAAHPELALLFAVPNGGHRSKATAGRLKAEGVKAGVPDLCLPVPRGGSHGLFVELKRRKGSTTSPEQREWLSRLAGQGYATVVAKGWDEAAESITRYLSMEPV